MALSQETHLIFLCELKLTFYHSDGVLKEYLASGVSKEDFLARMKAVLGDNESQPTSRAATLTTSIDEHGHDGITRTVALPGSAPMSPRASNGIIQAVESQSQNRSSSMAAVLEERRVRPETDKKAREAADKAERAKAAAKRKEELDVGESSDPRRAADMKYALMQKKRQQDAREERERILRQIEDDKKERKAIVEERKVQAKAVAGEHTNPFMAPSSKKKSITRGDTCALQVRLFDGSTIRQRFSLTDTLEKDVRKWIDQEQQIAGSPYTFKQILAPLPNKAISVSEESGTLEDLGLVPNATLVIIPVTDYTHAYDSGLGLTGVVTGAASAGFGLVSSATGLVGSGFGFAARALGNVLGGSAPQETSAAPPAEQSPPRERERQQLYNGGGVSAQRVPIFHAFTDRSSSILSPAEIKTTRKIKGWD